MPKRKRTKKYEDELDYLMHKVRKLERKIRSHSGSDSSYDGSVREEFVLQETASPVLRPDDWFPEYPDDGCIYDPLNTNKDQFRPIENHQNSAKTLQNSVEEQPEPIEAEQSTQPPLEPSTQVISANTSDTPVASTSTVQVDLDDDVLKILGDEPSSAMKYGEDIRTEIATRLAHVATEGIPKETRRDIIAKYLVPANCVHIGAPKLNPEIKAAISENFIKRDKGIESKQKEMASAISCLGEIITSQLNLKEKNNDLLQKLIDLSRILCDLQYADSVTRRNFILFTLKKDLKDHLVNTKIDAWLFGENLTETIKTAKTVNKSGVDIKAVAPKPVATQNRRPRSAVSRPLNRRGPASRRPPPGPPPPAPAPRGRAPAPRVPPPRPRRRRGVTTGRRTRTSPRSAATRSS
ncbi:uncharacterized protein [Choristoneura fumiferana]|uniref:uncharacterized protein n=1 Tax=Choristoneura fumiferana TaxID=7141 RepID=UPI003D154FCB